MFGHAHKNPVSYQHPYCDIQEISPTPPDASRWLFCLTCSNFFVEQSARCRHDSRRI